MSRILLLNPILLCALASACAEQSNPAEIASSPEPEFRTEQSGEGPGAQVIRLDGSTVAFRFPDAFGNTITLGFTLDALAAFCADGPFVGEPSRVQRVLRPDGSLTDLTKARDLTLMVIPGTGDGICAVPPFAIGSGTFMNNDNDGFVSGNRGNAFGFRVFGQVVDVNGDQHLVQGGFHGVIDKDGEVRVTKSGFTVR